MVYNIRNIIFWQGDIGYLLAFLLFIIYLLFDYYLIIN